MRGGDLAFNLVVCAVLAAPFVVLSVVASAKRTERWRAVAAFCVCMLVGLLVTATAATVLEHRRRAARKGWNLIPVLVAGQERPAGTLLTYDVLQQRMIPEQFVVGSHVGPAEVSRIVGRPIIGAVQVGDPITWALLGDCLQRACPTPRP